LPRKPHLFLLVIEVADDRGRFGGGERACQFDRCLQRKVYIAVAVAVRQRMQGSPRGRQSGPINDPLQL